MSDRAIMLAFASVACALAAGAALAQPTPSGAPDPLGAVQSLECPYETTSAIYVDDDNAGGVQDGSPEHPYARIQQAIDVALAGDVIVVRAGEYAESIVVHESVELIGAGAGETILRDCEPNSVDLLRVDAPDVRMCGFAVRACGDAIVSVLADGFVMRACEVDGADTDWFGVDMEYVGHCRIESNRILNAQIILDGACRNQIVGNQISDNGYVTLRGGACENVVRANTISGSDYYAIRLWDDAYDNLIDGNIIRNNRNGVSVYGSYLNTISSNTFAGNEFDGIYLDDAGTITIRDNSFETGGGIRFSRLDRDPWDWNTHIISGNTVDGAPIYYYNGANGVTVPADAAQVILVNCANVTIAGLTLSHATAPIQVGFSSHVSVLNNQIHSDWYSTGVLMVGSQHSDITGNTFESTYTTYKYAQASGIEAISITDGSDDRIVGNTIIGFNLGIGRWNWRPTSNNVISDNNITSWNYGVQLHSYYGAVTDTTISNNRIEGGVWGGLIVSSWPGLSVTDNTFVDSGLRLTGDDPNQWHAYEVTNNTVNGRPLYYFRDQTDLVVPSDAGQVILFNCSDFDVSGLNLGSATVGVTAAFCQGGEIAANSIAGVGYAGILLNGSTNVACVDNDLHGYERSIQLGQHSDGVLVAGNRISGAIATSINVNRSDNVVIDNNHVLESGEDFSPYPQNGIQLNYVNGATVSNNTIRCITSAGMSVSDGSTGNMFVANSVAHCRTALNLSLHSNDNQIHGNQFVDSWQRAAGEYDVSGNIWTGPTGGNYWSDFEQNPGYPDYYLIGGSESKEGQSRDTAPLPERIRAPYACGDVNESCGPVDIGDLSDFLTCFERQPTEYCAAADLDGNGAIEAADLALMLNLFGRSPACEAPDCASCP